MCLQASKALVFIYRLSHACGGLPINIACKLFDFIVLPILSYGREMWWYEQIASIQKVHIIKFLKTILKVSITTSDEAGLGEVGRYPLSVSSSVKCRSYWLKIVKVSENMIVKQVYIMLNKLDGVARKNWVSQIRFLLKGLCFEYLWLQQGVQNDPLFFRNISVKGKRIVL